MKKKNIIKLEERINNIEKLALQDLENSKLSEPVKKNMPYVFTGMRFCVGLLEEDKLMYEDDKIIAESIVAGTTIVMSLSALGKLFDSIEVNVKDGDYE